MPKTLSTTSLDLQLRIVLKAIVKAILALFSTFFLIPSFLIFNATFYAHKKLVAAILKHRHGEKFGGMFEGTDAFFASKNETESTPIIMLLVCFNGKPGRLYASIKKKIYEDFFANPDLYPRLTGFRRRFWGYFYLTRHEFSVDDCVRVLDLETDAEIADAGAFQKMMNDLGAKPLPKNHMANWEVLVGNRPLLWKDKTRKRYPVLIRIHHSVMDGITTLKWIVSTVFDQNTVLKGDVMTKPLPKQPKPTQSFILSASKKLRTLVALVEWSMRFTEMFLTRATFGEPQAAKLTGRKILCSRTENERCYFKKMKHIKNAFGVTFVDVVLAALSGTLFNFFKSSLREAPGNVRIVLPAARKFTKHNYRDYEPGKPIELNNNTFTYRFVEVPLISGEAAIGEVFREIKKRTDKLNNSMDLTVNHLILECCGVFPKAVMDFIDDAVMDANMIFSNLPGTLNQMTICGGLQIDDVVSWTVNSGRIGITLLLTSYDERLQLSLMADKALVSNRIDGMKIVDGFFERIDSLHGQSGHA